MDNPESKSLMRGETSFFAEGIEYYLKIFMIQETPVVTMAIATTGIHPISVTAGTSSSVTFTMMIDMTKEKSHSVMSLSGNVTIRRIVPSMRFVTASTTENISALIYPLLRMMPSTR